MRSQWLRFDIVSGRILVTGASINNISQTATIGNRSERISLGMKEGQPTVDYQATSAQDQFSVLVKGGGAVTIRRIPRDQSEVEPIEYSQQSVDEPVVLSVGTADHRQVYRAPSIWHLLLSETDVAHRCLAPLLETVRPDWRLEERTLEIEQELLRMAAAGRVPDRQQWATLVTQLADDRFAKRQAADRALREAGIAVLPYLRQLDLARLEPEQQFRIRRIMGSLVHEFEEDTSEQTAAWLQGDPQVWLVLLSRSSLPTRQTAVRQLSKLLAQPIAFDPAASEDVRKEQFEKLRASLSQH
jgi:hypothetical protein